jgi:hypothetical protein
MYDMTRLGHFVYLISLVFVHKEPNLPIDLNHMVSLAKKKIGAFKLRILASYSSRLPPWTRYAKGKRKRLKKEID